MLEAQQGDRISGKISRKQVASVAVAALGTDASIGEGQALLDHCTPCYFGLLGVCPRARVQDLWFGV